MEDPGLKQALWDVGQALDRVHMAFEDLLQDLRQGGGEPAVIRQANEALVSLRSSAAIYLAWAYYYAGVPNPDDQVTLPEI